MGFYRSQAQLDFIFKHHIWCKSQPDNEIAFTMDLQGHELHSRIPSCRRVESEGAAVILLNTLHVQKVPLPHIKRRVFGAHYYWQGKW